MEAQFSLCQSCEVGSVTDSWEIIHYSQWRWRGGTTSEEGAGKAEGWGLNWELPPGPIAAGKGWF